MRTPDRWIYRIITDAGSLVARQLRTTALCAALAMLLPQGCVTYHAQGPDKTETSVRGFLVSASVAKLAMSTRQMGSNYSHAVGLTDMDGKSEAGQLAEILKVLVLLRGGTIPDK